MNLNLRQRMILVVLVMSACIAARPILVHAAAPQMAAPVGLSIVEIKITGDEFIIIQNNTGQAISNLSSYWLTAYNNVNPLATGVSNSSQQLPTASLAQGQTLQLSADTMATCGAALAGKLSVSLSDAGGYLQINRLSIGASGAVNQTPSDMVSWSSGTNGSIQNVPSSTKNPRAVYYRYFSGNGYAWQQADTDTSQVCQLNIVVAGGLEPSTAITPLTLAATSPPATILGVVTAGDGELKAQIPAADIGLNAPQLSELLPNPIGSGNDGTDEFIELYNPNAKEFDLSGFILQTGTTTTRQYIFPTGTSLPANSFKAFYAEETKLSLSNTSSRVALFDPLGNPISVAGEYSKAKDGYTWAVAKNQWFWTTQPTPGAANVIKQPAVSKTKKSNSKVATKSLGASSKAVNNKTVSTTNTGNFFEELEQKTPIHPMILALVIGGAVLYGAYEYRRDIANRLHQLRTKLGFRSANRRQAEGRRSD